MIDFRYHLISIVAVLLALSCGVVLGSGVLGGPLLDDVRQRAEDVRKTNEEVRELADERLQVVDRYMAFTEASIPYLLEGALADVDVVAITSDGTDQDIIESLADLIETAGGELSGTLRFKTRFVLDDQIPADQLALAIGSVDSEPELLRAEAGRVIGGRLGAAASGQVGDPSHQRLMSLLESLAEADFISVDAPDEGLVSGESVFLVVAGGPEDPPFPTSNLFTALVQALSRRDATVMVGEPAGSAWALLGGDSGGGDVRRSVSTGGNIEELPGQLAAVLGLARAITEGPLHVGLGGDSDMILPSPAPPTPTDPELQPEPGSERDPTP